MSDLPAYPGLARRGAGTLAVAVVAVLALSAAWLVPWSWVPGGALRALPPEAVFSADELARAEEYASLQRVLGLTAYAVSLGTAAALGFTSWGPRLARRLTRAWSIWLAVPLIVLVALLLGRLVTLPLALAGRQHRLEFGLTRQGLGGWAVDYLTSFGLELVVTSLVVLMLVGLARWRPRTWFAWAGAATMVLAFAGSFAYPVVVEPLFNRYESMPEGTLKQAIMSMAERGAVDVDDVLVADASRRTTTLNAYVSGIGATRRVVVYDNLLDGVPPAQVRSVVAHELAHARHRDVLVGTGLGSLGAVLGICLVAFLLDSSRVRRRLGVSGPQDPAAVPLLLALAAVGLLLVSPLQNAVSRAVEARADRDALALTGEPAPFLELQKALAVKSLADPTPPTVLYIWFASHPTALQRSGMPSSLERADG